MSGGWDRPWGRPKAHVWLAFATAETAGAFIGTLQGRKAFSPMRKPDQVAFSSHRRSRRRTRQRKEEAKKASRDKGHSAGPRPRQLSPSLLLALSLASWSTHIFGLCSAFSRRRNQGNSCGPQFASGAAHSIAYPKVLPPTSVMPLTTWKNLPLDQLIPADSLWLRIHKSVSAIGLYSMAVISAIPWPSTPWAQPVRHIQVRNIKFNHYFKVN